MNNETRIKLLDQYSRDPSSIRKELRPVDTCTQEWAQLSKEHFAWFQIEGRFYKSVQEYIDVHRLLTYYCNNKPINYKLETTHHLIVALKKSTDPKLSRTLMDIAPRLSPEYQNKLMREATIAKFQQNHDLLKKLMETQERPIVYSSITTDASLILMEVRTALVCKRILEG